MASLASSGSVQDKGIDSEKNGASLLSPDGNSLEDGGSWDVFLAKKLNQQKNKNVLDPK